jgi:CRP/FNR family transcriptional regulator
VIKYSGNRLKEAQETTNDLALDCADHWLASLLVDRATRNGMKDPNGIRLTIRMTRQDMANYEGVGQAVTWLGNFFRFFNEEGRHQALAYRTLAEIYKAA